MHACATCDDLRRQVRELEETLDRAIWVERSDRTRLVSALNISGQQSDLVALLYKNDGFLMWRDIDTGLPRTGSYGMGGGSVSGAEFRAQSFVTAVIHQARKRLPPGFIESRQGLGYRLSDQARERVHQILNTENRQ